LSGCAGCSSRVALRIVMVSPSQAIASPGDSYSRSIIVLQRCPARRSGGVAFTDRDQHLDR
jgi:hypothetical protein